MTHWVSIRYGISAWKAARWVAAAHALDGLTRTARALAAGDLGIDKVVELCRFVTPQAEAGLLRWAQTVSCGAIRRRGDLEIRRRQDEAAQVDRDRFLSWCYVDDGRRMAIEAELPADQGAAVVAAIERMTARIPVMPDEGAGTNGCELEGGPAIHPETVRRLLCNARVQTVLEDGKGDVAGMGRLSREPSAWMVRQLRWRDRECRFPGRGRRAFTEAHHVVWWSRGGRTDLENLVLICSFHHRLVLEYGWRIARVPDGRVRWFRPDGTRYRSGPSRATPEQRPDRLPLARTG